MGVRVSKPLKRLLVGLAAVLVATGLLIGGFGFVVGRVPAYRDQLQVWLSERSGLDIEFRTIGARLRLYGPELVFDDALVRTPDRSQVLVAASRGSVGFDVWAALRTGRLSAGRFMLEAPRIDLVRTPEGRIELLGQSALPERTDSRAFSLDQLPTGRFNVRRAVVSFRDELTGRGPWSLSGVSFVLARDPATMRLHGDASLPHSLGRELTFTASAEGALEDASALVSTFSVTGTGIDLGGWSDVLPDAWPALETGYGTVKLSGRMRGATLSRLSADVRLTDVAAALPQWTIALPGAEPMRQPPGPRSAPRRPEAYGAKQTDRQAIAGHFASPQSAPFQGDPPENVSIPPSQLPEAPQPAQPAFATQRPDFPEASQAPQPPQLLSYDRVVFALRLRHQSDAWTLTLSDLDVSTSSSPWRASDIHVRWSHGEAGTFRLEGGADRLILQNLWPLLSYLPESESLAWLRALDAHGRVEGLEVLYDKTGRDVPAHYTLGGRLTDFAFEPLGRTPGLAGVSGELQATEKGGRGTLEANGLRFVLPRLFREPIVVQSLRGSLAWQRSAQGWEVSGENMRVQSPDGDAEAKFELVLPKDGSSPVLNLQADAQNLLVASTSRYMPAGRLTATTMEWFDHAFVAGKVSAAQLSLQGPVRSFPFRNDEGSFVARGHVESAIFNYQRGWTPARDITADLEFRNESLTVRANTASVDELQLQEARAQIADLKEARIVIDAAAKGQLQHGLRFLKHSPLAPALGDYFARLSGTGPIESDVHMDLPIKSFKDRLIEVTTRLADARVSLQGLDAPVSDLTGVLTIRNRQLAAAELSGQWLGGALQVRAQAEEDQDPELSVLSAVGRAEAQKLHALLGLPAAVRLAGTTGWRVTTSYRPAQDAVPRSWSVNIDSDLAGLAVELPEPLGKQAGDSRALQLALQSVGDDALLARASLDEVRSLIRLHRNGTHGGIWSLDRGGLRADGIPPSLPDHQGLRVEGTLRQFVLDDWLALRSGEGQGPAMSDYLQAANLRIGEFRLFGYAWHDVRGVLQFTSSGWRVDVDGPDASGQMIIPESFTGAQPLRATLERLVLRPVSDLDVDAGIRIGGDGKADPRKLPGLQVHVSDLRWGDRMIGALNLSASRVVQGIRFDSVEVNGASAQGQAQGEWIVTNQGQHSSMSATLTSSNVAATLASLGYSPFIDARKGQVEASVAWPSGFGDNIMAHASGTISVSAEAGQLVNLQPGAGRVLGLFSVAALPRRLALDFSDLTDKGLAFDTIHGDFKLRDGNAYTSNLLLSGPAAEIGIAGRTGLRARDYDQTAVVTGNLGASLPVAGVLAGGPAVGAAMLLFSKVFKEPLKGITRGYYRITGSWEEPVIERVDAAASHTDARPEATPPAARGPGGVGLEAGHGVGQEAGRDTTADSRTD